jgi:hypothetical protein
VRLSRAGAVFALLIASVLASCASSRNPRSGRAIPAIRLSVEKLEGFGESGGEGYFARSRFASRYGAWVQGRNEISGADGGFVAVLADGKAFRADSASPIPGMRVGGIIRGPGALSGASGESPFLWAKDIEGKVSLYTSGFEPLGESEPALAFADGRPGIILKTDGAYLLFSEDEGRGLRDRVLKVDRFKRPDDADGESLLVNAGGFRELRDACPGRDGLACALVAKDGGFEIRGIRVSDLSDAFAFPVPEEASRNPRGIIFDAEESAYLVYDRGGFAAFKAEEGGIGSLVGTWRLPLPRAAGASAGADPAAVVLDGVIRILSLGISSPRSKDYPFIVLAEGSGKVFALKARKGRDGILEMEPSARILDSGPGPVETLASFPDGTVIAASRGALSGADGALRVSLNRRPRALLRAGEEGMVCAFDPAGLSYIGIDASGDGPLAAGFSVDALVSVDETWVHFTGLEAGESGLYRFPRSGLSTPFPPPRERIAVVPAGGFSLTAGAHDSAGNWLLTDGFRLYASGPALEVFSAVDIPGIGSGGRIVSILPLPSGAFALVSENGRIRVFEAASASVAYVADSPITERILCACLDARDPAGRSILVGTASGSVLGLKGLIRSPPIGRNEKSRTPTGPAR